MQFSPISRYSFPIRSKLYPQHSILDTLPTYVPTLSLKYYVPHKYERTDKSKFFILVSRRAEDIKFLTKQEVFLESNLLLIYS
jgi:hypothetical protein